jgi:hypothetical protein
MNTVGPDLSSQLDIVIDDQQGTMIVTQALKRIGLGQAPGALVCLIPVLNYVNTTEQCLPHIREQAACGAELSVGDGIKPTQTGGLISFHQGVDS